MSGENREDYHHGFSFHDDLLYSIFSQKPGADGLQGIDAPTGPPFTSFSDFLHGSTTTDCSVPARGVDASRPQPDVLGGAYEQCELVVGGDSSKNSTPAGRGDGMTPVTPNFSMSSSSTEVGGEEDSDPCKMDQLKQEEEEEKQAKGGAEVGDKFKKVNKPIRKKGEKRQRESRFAFMTKSEVDHLEDGYRWRKYGQKAVKNSPYPRSYYRCTTQKCNVKKRVERSYQDPEIVITTYEGQHTHHSPANLRGSSTHWLSPSLMTSTNFGRNLLLQQVSPRSSNSQEGYTNPNMYLPNVRPSPQQLQVPDYGLLQDLVPSFSHSSHQ